MKDNKTLDSLIATKEAELERLEEKQAGIAKRIRACKADIEKYRLMKNNQRFNEIANALDDKGISVEDVLSAIIAGDMISLQEKIEQNAGADSVGEEGQESNGQQE